MYLTFSNLNSIHWIIKKKDIGLYVLFRTFHDDFQVKLFPPKKIFLFFFFKYSLNIYNTKNRDDEDKVHIISPVPRESPFRLPVKKRKVGTYRHTQKTTVHLGLQA